MRWRGARLDMEEGVEKLERTEHVMLLGFLFSVSSFP